MYAVTDAIGLVSGALGIVSFFQDLFPSMDAQGASITVKIVLKVSTKTQAW
jgi:hypothetical protein